MLKPWYNYQQEEELESEEGIVHGFAPWHVPMDVFFVDR